MKHRPGGTVDLNPPVTIQPNVGLDGNARNAVVALLNTFLADEAILKMKTHNARWKASGVGSIELRLLFDQQTHLLGRLLSEIVERVCILGGHATSSFEECLKNTRLKEKPGEALDLLDLLADHEAVIRSSREDARKCLEDYDDHGTFVLLVHMIRRHEKMAWILRSLLAPDQALDEEPADQAQPTLRWTRP